MEGEGEFSDLVARGAPAAMAAATADYPLPNSLPDRPGVEQLLSRSRFTVAPRAEASAAVSDAAAATAQPLSLRSDASRRSSSKSAEPGSPRTAGLDI